jgi:hypothetical protein
MNIQVYHCKSKALVSLIFVLVTGNITRAQILTEAYNNLLRHFQDTIISLSSTNNNIIHGIDNKILILNKQFKGDKNILIDNRYILSRDDSVFVLQAPDPGSTENITLLVENHKNDTIFRHTFRNERLPLPAIYIGHINLSETKKLSLSDLQLADSVYLFYRHSLAGSSEWLKVKQFKIGYSYGSYYITHENIGKLISPKVKSVLQGLKPGQEVSISIITEGTGTLSKEVGLLYFRIQ